MADPLIFYTNPMSRGQIVRWMLEEVGAPYETHILDYGSTMKGEDYLAINPMGKVPAIVHDGRVVTECAAICAYLADAFPAAGLAPRDEETRRLLPLAVLRRRAGRAGGDQQGGGLRARRRRRSACSATAITTVVAHARRTAVEPRLCLRRPLHRRRRLCRRDDQLGHPVRHFADARQFSSLMPSASPARRPTGGPRRSTMR